LPSNKKKKTSTTLPAATTARGESDGRGTMLGGMGHYLPKHPKKNPGHKGACVKLKKGQVEKETLGRRVISR